VKRILVYYWKLMSYAATAKPKVFTSCEQQVEFFDRTLLMLCYRMFGKRVILTAHTSTPGAGCGDSPLNRLTLKIQYRSARTSLCIRKR